MSVTSEQDPVDPGPRDHRGELLEKLERREHEGAGAIVPGMREGDADPAFGEELQPLLRERGSDKIAAEALEAGPIAGTECPVGVQVEPAERSDRRR